MSVWALADLHLPFSDPTKHMDVFGPDWENYTERIEENWNRLVGEDDLVLVAGDTSWAMKPDEAKADLEWVDALKGTKVICKGNHDYWWQSSSKVQKLLPPSIHFVDRGVWDWEDVSIAGTRLWDSQEFGFLQYTHVVENPREKRLEPKPEVNEKIYERELGRLERALQGLRKDARWKVAMTHYPPIGGDLTESRASKLIEEHGVHFAVFGHLHNIQRGVPLFGEKNGVHYVLTSCDYLECTPVKLI